MGFVYARQSRVHGIVEHPIAAAMPMSQALSLGMSVVELNELLTAVIAGSRDLQSDCLVGLPLSTQPLFSDNNCAYTSPLLG